MKKITAEKLVEQNSEFELYSGRDKYGKTTYGVYVYTITDLITAIFQLGLNYSNVSSTEIQIIQEDLRNINWNNLGERFIVY